MIDLKAAAIAMQGVLVKLERLFYIILDALGGRPSNPVASKSGSGSDLLRLDTTYHMALPAGSSTLVDCGQ